MYKARGSYTVSDFFASAGLQCSGGPWSLAAWVYPTDVSVFSTIWGVSKSTDDTSRLRLAITNGAVVRAQMRNGGTTVNADAPGSAAAGAWQFMALTCTAANKLRAWLGAGAGSESVVAITYPSGMNRTALGNNWDATPDQPLIGYLGPVGGWDRKLDDAELIALAGGMDFRYRAAGLLHYYEPDGVGDVLDRIGSFNFSEQGTVAEQTGPAIRPRMIEGPWSLDFGARA